MQKHTGIIRVSIGNAHRPRAAITNNTAACCFFVPKKGVTVMPKNLFQEIVFTFIMVIVMVYAMICYNIALDFGVLNNTVFIAAFSEL